MIQDINGDEGGIEVPQRRMHRSYKSRPVPGHEAESLIPNTGGDYFGGKNYTLQESIDKNVLIASTLSLFVRLKI